MALIEWSDNYSVQIPTIDAQHQSLVDMINEFYDSIKEKSGDAALMKLLSKMKQYVIFHFAKEEKLFDKYNYPDAENHKREHAMFVDKVRQVEEKLKNGQMVLSFEITNFLKDWLLRHIQHTDQKYSVFLIERGEV